MRDPRETGGGSHAILISKRAFALKFAQKPSHSPLPAQAVRVARAPAAARVPRAESRLPQVLDAAAAQFAAKGYQATSVRDIVSAVGMLPGSLYCHFTNKDELLAAVYAEGVRRIDRAVEVAVEGHVDAWQRLEAACVAHLESLLDDSAYAKVVVSVGPGGAPALAPTLRRLRGAYEQRFVGLIDALPLPARTSRPMLRLMLLGALNWSPTWYRADHSAGRSPRQVARAFVRLLRQPLQELPS